MTLVPLYTAAIAVLVFSGTITVGLHIPGKRPNRKLIHRATESCKQTKKSNWSSPILRYRGDRGDVAYNSNCCKTCWMAVEDSSRFFIPYRRDGIGMRAVALLHGMAIAAYYKMNFGGALAPHPKWIINQCHHTNCDEMTLSLFGEDRDLLVPYNYPMDFTFHTIYDLQQNNFIESVRNKHIFINDTGLGNNCQGSGFIGIDKYFTPQFLDAFTVQTNSIFQPTNFFRTKRPSVAIHLRRGDVNETTEIRHTPDKYYFKVVKRLRRYLPDADIHVFSTTEKYWGSQHFDGYRKRNMTVHLNGKVLTDWSHMAQADVFIMAKSAFSFVPAYANRKCVVYQDFCYEPLHTWTNGTAALDYQSDLLERCLARIGKGMVIHSHA